MKRKRTPATTPALIEIQRRGLDALAKELGPEGLIRFFQLYGMGEGDYTHERKKWLKSTSVENIAAHIGITKKGK